MDQPTKIIDIQRTSIWDAGDASKAEYKSNYSTNVFTAPPQEIPDAEKTPSWYLWNARYFSSFYNRRTYPFYGASNSATSTVNGQGAGQSESIYPVTEMLENQMFRHGKQINSSYNWMVQDNTTGNLQPFWINDRHIGTLWDNADGVMTELISNAYFSVRRMSPDAQSKKSDFLNSLVLSTKYKGFFDSLAENGVQFAPGNGQQFETPEQAKDFVENGGYKDVLGDKCTDISSGLWVDGHWMEKGIQNFDWFLSNGVCGMGHFVEGGKQYAEIYPGENLIMDLRKDNTYNEDAQFVGVIRFLTPSEIFNRWKVFNDEQKKEIEMLASSFSNASIYNSIISGFSGQFSWWAQNSNQMPGLIACTSIYWIGRQNNGQKKVTTKYDNTKYVDAPGEGDYYDSGHQVNIVGNRWIVDFGEKSNQIRDITNKNRVRLPIQIFAPRTLKGQIISPTSKIKQLSNEASMALFKCNENIGKADGRKFVFDGSLLAGMGENAAMEMEKDLKQIGFTIINRETGEPGDEARKNARFMETMDMTLDPNFQQILNFRQLLHTEMEEITAIPKTALGQQQQYIGNFTMQQSLSQSALGMSYMIHGYMNFLQRNMQYASDLYKMTSYVSTDTQRPLLIGADGIKFFSMTKEECFEDLLVYLNIDDVIEKSNKDRLVAAADKGFQTGQITFLDLVEVEMSKTYSKLRKYFVKVIGEAKADARRQQAIEAMQLQAQNEQRNQAMMAQTAIQTHGKLLGQGLKGEQDNVNAQLPATVPAQQ